MKVSETENFDRERLYEEFEVFAYWVLTFGVSGWCILCLRNLLLRIYLVMYTFATQYQFR